MTFSESYKKDNQKIEPSPELKAYITRRLENAETNTGKKEYFKTTFWRCTAAVLSLVFLAAAVYVGSEFTKPKITVASSITQSVASVAEASSEVSSQASSKPVSSSSAKPVYNGIKARSLKGVKYAQIYDSFKELEDKMPEYYSKFASGGVLYSRIPARPSDSFGLNSPDADDYSKTNTQVEGVDEADIVKTDGQYIYYLNNQKIVIVSAQNGYLNKVSEIFLPNSNKIGMYISGNRLALIGYEYYNSKTKSEYVLTIYIYDITDKRSPKLLKRVGQSGSYVSSRLAGGVIYLFSNKSFSNKAIKEKPQTYVPSTYINGTQKVIAEKDICVFDGAVAKEYFVAGAFRLSDGAQISVKCVLGGGDTVYANTQNILVAAKGVGSYYITVGSAANAQSSISKTRLIRLSINNGKIEGKAFAAVPGKLLNQFSMDEYDNHFRLVTTIYTQSGTSNALYVLNQSLKTVGKIENLAKDEQVYSVRFLGKIGYFVTFRQVDPLFTVDLSKPNAPKVLSALKIPGFSTYLHPYSDGLLFGLGMNADETTGRTQTMKLSMFDVSAPSNVIEKHKISVNCYYSEASYNHKAILINKKNDIIGFPGVNSYFIFGYSPQKGFYKRAELDCASVNARFFTRGVFIGKYFYLCEYDGILSYSMKNWQLVDSVIF